MRLSQNVDYSTDLVMGYEVKNLITGNKLLQEVHLGRPPVITSVTDLVIGDANTFTEAPAPGRRGSDRHPLTVKYRAKHQDTFHDICD